MNPARVMYPRSKLLFVRFIESNPIRGSGVQPARLDDAAIDPVINHVRADSEPLSHLLNGQLFRPREPGLGNLVAVADPLDHRTGKGFAERANVPFSIETHGDFHVRQ